jgi:hypothetical protein
MEKSDEMKTMFLLACCDAFTLHMHHLCVSCHLQFWKKKDEYKYHAWLFIKAELREAEVYANSNNVNFTVWDMEGF